MFRINKVIRSTADQIEILPTGDWHFGSPNCNLKKIIELVEYIKKSQCWVILMGDLWDSIIPSDKRFDPEEEYQVIDEQYDFIRDKIAPIKAQVLCALTGNHEYKLHTSGHGDLTRRLAKELGIPYGGFSSLIKIKVIPKTHQRSLIIYAHHGWTSGRKTGGVINAVENISQYYDADVYLVGHSHKLSSTKQVKIGWAGSRDILFCNTGTYLETSTWNRIGYAERVGFPPQRIGCLKVKYYPKKGKIYATE